MFRFFKAFDAGGRDTLLLKLKHYDVRGSALKWFKSYLSNRQQYVTYNGVSSQLKNINCGVPQGSVLGPLLFLLYINDLSNVCKCTMPLVFADDINLFINGSELDGLESLTNLWTSCLLISIKHIHDLHNQKKKHAWCCHQLCRDIINESDSTNMLGIYLDHKLNWKKNTLHLCRETLHEALV